MFYAALFLLSSYFHCIAGQSTQDVAQIFKTMQIVPDVIPEFHPIVPFQVTYNITVFPGQNLTKKGLVPS
jgi:hypothetical protein